MCNQRCLCACAGKFLGISWCFQIQLVECGDLLVCLYTFGVYSTNSSMLIIEVLNINQLRMKLNRFMCD
jgi:hypothetical protein